MNQLGDFVKIRKWFTYGPSRDYFDHANCLGWVREGDADHDGCAIVICNGNETGTKRMQIPAGHAGEVWTEVLGWSQGEITIGDDVSFIMDLDFESSADVAIGMGRVPLSRSIGLGMGEARCKGSRGVLARCDRCSVICDFLVTDTDGGRWTYRIGEVLSSVNLFDPIVHLAASCRSRAN